MVEKDKREFICKLRYPIFKVEADNRQGAYYEALKTLKTVLAVNLFKFIECEPAES